MDSLNILVTGASGFLGAQISSYLTEQGHRVFPIFGRKDFHQANQVLSSQKIQCLIHNGFSVDFSPASGPAEESENVRNSSQLWQWAKNNSVEHFIFISAAGVFGVRKAAKSVNEGNWGQTDPEFLDYQQTKYIQEKMVAEKSFVPEDAMNLCKLYLSTVYGPQMPASTLAALRCSGCCPVMVVPPGGTSYLDLREFLEYLGRVIHARLSGGHIVSSGDCTFKELFSTACQVQGKKKYFFTLPTCSLSLVRFFAFILKKLGIHLAVLKSSFGHKYYSPKLLQEKLGLLKPRPLNETLEFTLRQ